MKKTVTLIGLVAVTLLACKKEGMKGKDGKDGQNGNANVAVYIFDSVKHEPNFFSNSTWSCDIPVTEAELRQDAFLQYIKINHIYYSSLYVAVPGPVRSTYQASVNYSYNSTDSSRLTIFAEDWDGNGYSVSGTDTVLPQIKVIHIKAVDGNLATIARSNKTQTEIIKNQLIKEGVDINNYKDVCRYYGIKP